MSNVVSENELRKVIRDSLGEEDDDTRSLNELSFSKLLGQVPEASVMAFKQFLIERLFDYLASAGFPITKTSGAFV